MSFPRLLLVLVAAPSLALAVGAGCGSTSTASGTGGSDAGDGRYHPNTDNGTHTGESAACAELTKAQQTLLLNSQCTVTVQTCPNFLRAQFTTTCMEYDEGSVQGCIAYYGKQVGCDAIKTAIADCAVTPFAASAPKGCADGGT